MDLSSTQPAVSDPGSSNTRTFSWLRIALTIPLLLGVLFPLALTVSAAFTTEYGQCKTPSDHLICGDYGSQQSTWVNGNINQNDSSYVEGTAVFQRAVWKDLPNQRVHTFVWNLSWNSGLQHGYDYIVSWPQAQQVFHDMVGVDIEVQPCSGVGNQLDTQCAALHTSGYTTTVAAPPDPFVTGSYQMTSSVQSRIDAFEDVYDPRTIALLTNRPVDAAKLTLRHVDLNSGVTLANGGDTGGMTYVEYTLVFTQTTWGNGDYAMVKYAGHLGLSGNPWIEPMAWGEKIGAGAITGSSWHMKDPKIDGLGGSQDNQTNLNGAALSPISSSASRNSSTGAVADYITVTSVYAHDITGTVGFYLCRDATPPYSPATSTSLQNGCVTTSDGPGYTVSKVGEVSLTLNNQGQTKVSIATSPPYTVNDFGFYCFMTVFTPTGPTPYRYPVSADTNNGSECFGLEGGTAVKLTDFKGVGLDRLAIAGFGLPGIIAGLIGVVACVGIWWVARREA